MSLRRWTEEEKQRVREMSEYATAYEIAQALGRTIDSLKKVASHEQIPLMHVKGCFSRRVHKHLAERRESCVKTGAQSKVSEISKRQTTIDVENDDLITTADAAKILCASVTEVRRWVGAGKQLSSGKKVRLECVIFRGVTCTTAEAVERFKEATRQGPE